MRATNDTMRENNDHILTGAWWVTLKSQDLFLKRKLGRNEFLRSVAIGRYF